MGGQSADARTLEGDRSTGSRTATEALPLHSERYLPHQSSCRSQTSIRNGGRSPFLGLAKNKRTSASWLCGGTHEFGAELPSWGLPQSRRSSSPNYHIGSPAKGHSRTASARGDRVQATGALMKIGISSRKWPILLAFFQRRMPCALLPRMPAHAESEFSDFPFSFT